MGSFVHQSSIQKMGQFKINYLESDKGFFLYSLWPKNSLPRLKNAYVCICIDVNGKLEKFLLKHHQIVLCI